jgi:hypothetical protein
MMIRDCDVHVVGGGPAGIAAAVAAARSGARVVLIEKYGFLGGMAAAGMAGAVCGLYNRAGEPTDQLSCSGFVRELAERLEQSPSAHVVHLDHGLHALAYDPWRFRLVADSLLSETALVKTALHTTLCSLKLQNENSWVAQALAWDRLVEVRSTTVVDCTGEATAVSLAGGETMDETSKAFSVIFSLDSVESVLHSYSGLLSILRTIARAAEEGSLSPDCRNVSFVPGRTNGKQLFLKLTLKDDSTGDSFKMTRLEIRARKNIDELTRYLISSLEGFERARLSEAPTHVGIRIGRRAAGKRLLTEDDVSRCRKFDDGVACGTWPIEDWDDALRPRLKLLPEGEHYEIPAGCLITTASENMFVAGRCFSATTEAMGSARVIATAAATGWAAGTLAAFKATGRPRSAAISQLRQQQGLVQAATVQPISRRE